MQETYEDFIRNFLEQVKQIMRDKRIKQSDLCEILGVSSPSNVGKLLNGDSHVHLRHYYALADRFGLWRTVPQCWEFYEYDGRNLELVFNSFEEDKEKALMDYAKRYDKSLTKDVIKDEHYLNGQRIFSFRVVKGQK